MMQARRTAAFVVAALFGLSALAAAQAEVSQVDIQRLQDRVYDASRNIGDLAARDRSLAARLQAELDDARDEVIYLKVKLRKHEPIAHAEYSELRDRIDDIGSRARGEASRAARPSPPPAAAPPSRPPAAEATSDIPVGTEFDVRLQTSLSSASAQVEDRVQATTMVDLREGDRVLVPAGSLMRGIVSSVNKAGRIDRTGRLTLAFDQVTIRGRAYPIHATVTQALESEGVRGDTGKIATGAGVGAIIGGILGGFRGALAGILIGGGGTVAATEGKDVELPAGTALRVRLDSGLSPR